MADACKDGMGNCFSQCQCVCTELLNPDAGSDEEYEYAADDKYRALARQDSHSSPRDSSPIYMLFDR